MYIYICENSLNGVLTAVFYAYYNSAGLSRQTNEDVDLITSDTGKVLLTDTFKKIPEDKKLAERVLVGAEKLDKDAGYYISLVFSSPKEDKHNLIYKYLKLLFKTKKPPRFAFANLKEIYDFFRIVQAAEHEAQRLKGFIRFMEMDNGALYARYTSDNDILELIMPHFAERFSSENFIIHDVKRGKVAIHSVGGEYYYEKLIGEAVPVLSETEALYQSLWEEYQKNVTIPSRKNERLQSAFFPKRYRWFAK